MAVILSPFVRGFRGIVHRFFSKRPAGPAAVSRAAARGAARDVPPRRGPAIQSLESRTLYAAHPVPTGPVVGERLIGTDKAITAIVLTVNQHLDAVTADNPKAYYLSHFIISTSASSDGVFGFGGSDGGTSVTRIAIPFKSAVYDDASLTITLTPKTSFYAQKYFTFLRIRGRGPDAILTAQGTPIAGNGKTAGTDQLDYFKLHRNNHFSYTEKDGDRVTLILTGPGALRTFVHRSGAPNPILVLSGTDPVRSVLSGKVKKGRHGNGIADLQELAGVTEVQNELATNRAFRVDFTQP